MHRFFLSSFRFGCFICCFLLAAAGTFATDIPYGNNPAAGKYISLNGVRHYYEVYGEGAPLLLIHGNQTGISGFAPQIKYFSAKHRVYIIDCRGRGKSELGPDTLSYRQMAADMANFIRQLKLDSVNIIGKSDGAVVALLMGIYYPQHISKIVSFSANVQPDSTAFFQHSLDEIRDERLHAEKMLAANDTTKNWEIVRQRFRLMEFQPHITRRELQRIKAPVLVITSDRDLIKEEHSFFIYRSIPHAHLCILPGETHFVLRQNPDLFNSMVDLFLSRPFRDHATRFPK